MSRRSPHHHFTRRAFPTATAAAALYPRAANAAPHAEDIRRAVGAPAAGIAFQRQGQVTLSVAGKRAIGHETAVSEDDLWHLGSLTKSMTAVLAARLVEQGVISFDDTIGQRLNGVAKPLRAVTLEQLLHHRGGLAANAPPKAAIKLQGLEGTTAAPELRRQYLATVLKDAVLPAGAFLYSNAGYVAAAAMMEAATGRTWEDMIGEEVFAPLNLATPGFGPPGASTNAPDQPWGHAKGGEVIAFPPVKTSDNILALNSAGRVHMSLADFLTYLTAHAQRAPILKPESWVKLHKPVADASANYAMGWVSPSDAVRMHSGSNTIWFATGGFNTKGDAIAIVTNIGNGANLPGPGEQPALDFLTGV